MANETGNTAPSLKKSLLKNSDAFSFFQTIRILKRMQQDKTEEDFEKYIRIKPDLSLDHPGSDIVKTEKREDGGVDVFTTFLGLYGISSPLPTFYTEDLISSEQSGHNGARTFLDVIHQRLYSLFFKSLKKYRPVFDSVEGNSETYSDLLFSLMGLKNKTLLKKIKSPYKLLKYSSLLNQQPRSALGLKTLLENEFNGINFEVEQCVKRTVKIMSDQVSGVGKSSSSLGVDTVIGEEIEDRNGKIKIVIGPLKKQQFHEIINNSDKWNMLVFLIQFYITMPFECDLEFLLMENEANTTKLSEKSWSCLGKDTWLFSGKPGKASNAVLHLNLPNSPI